MKGKEFGPRSILITADKDLVRTGAAHIQGVERGQDGMVDEVRTTRRNERGRAGDGCGVDNRRVHDQRVETGLLEWIGGEGTSRPATPVTPVFLIDAPTTSR